MTEKPVNVMDYWRPEDDPEPTGTPNIVSALARAIKVLTDDP